MKNEQKVLVSYGLSPNESRVYLAMIESGHSTILEISKAAEIKRSTVYVTMEELINKNLVKTIIKGKKKYYLPEDPEKMLDLLDQKKEAINKIIPHLKNQFVSTSERPVINFYEGKEGVRIVYKEALSSKEETLWYGSSKDQKEEFYDYYLGMLQVRVNNPNFKGLRDIVNETRADKEYAKIQNSYKDSRIQVRTLKDGLFFMNTDNIIYDNKLAILSIKKNYFVTIIENQDIVNTYRTLFELAWKAAKKI